jgi:hypothetical protein
MPISIAGSGTITGISAGGLPDDCITTAEIAANAVTTAKLGSAEASGLAKAWVNFNGTGTVAIRASYNVSSITDVNVGRYNVNFTTAMPDTNYCVSFASSGVTSYTTSALAIGSSTGYSTSSVGLDNIWAGSYADSSSVFVAIFR